MIKCKWSLFANSFIDKNVLCNFANGNINTWEDFIDLAKIKECKEEVRKMRESKLGIDFWRKRAKPACRRLFNWSSKT
jgi:uncharacterized protein YggL (DUF469 family)